MNNHPGRLVDSPHHIIEKQEIERDLLGLRPRPRRLRHGVGDDHPRLQLERGLRHDAVNADRPGVLDDQNALFKSSLKRVDVTFQNLDSSEISLTDVSHYYDSDPTKVVKGLRKDGKKPMSMIADTTTANAQVKASSLPRCARGHHTLFSWTRFL
jgi:hypothetical protein